MTNRDFFDSHSEVNHHFDLVIATLRAMDRQNILSVVDKLVETYVNGGVVFTFGNGGSGATASHFCGDLIKGVSYGRTKRLKAICLNDNMPALMAIANDINYESIFIEQLKNFCSPKDLVIGFSGSGNSPNVVNALTYANEVGATTVAICGYLGGKIKNIAKLSIHAPIEDMEVSEDIHVVTTHCLKNVLIKRLNELDSKASAHLDKRIHEETSSTF